MVRRKVPAPNVRSNAWLVPVQPAFGRPIELCGSGRGRNPANQQPGGMLLEQPEGMDRRAARFEPIRGTGFEDAYASGALARGPSTMAAEPARMAVLGLGYGDRCVLKNVELRVLITGRAAGPRRTCWPSVLGV